MITEQKIITTAEPEVSEIVNTVFQFRIDSDFSDVVFDEIGFVVGVGHGMQ
jgi:hypothetical protein